MPAVLTHKAILLLARERLAELRDALKAKVRSGQNITSVDRRILALATRAHEILSTPPHPNTDLPEEPYVRPLGQEVSKFAVMGCMGPDITGFSALLAPGQAWVFDTIHKGTPDSQREAVVAGTCELPFALWRRVSSRITTELAGAGKEAERTAGLDKMRAYVLGHLCHLAGDIISHPLINDLEWHESNTLKPRLDHADGEVSHDALVARKVFLRGSTREGAGWDAWWPEVDDIPGQFFDAYADALNDVYGVSSRRRTGLSQFEKRFEDLKAPTATPDFVRDGYRMYRQGILRFGYGFGTWKWFAFLLPVTLPLMAFPLLAAAPPTTRWFFLQRESDVTVERAWVDLLSFALALGSFGSLFYLIWIASITTHGIRAESIVGLVLNAIAAGLGLAHLVTLGVDKMSVELRYILFVGVPATFILVQLIRAIVDSARDGREKVAGLAWIYIAPPLVLLVSALLSALIFEACQGDDHQLEPGFFILAAVLWSLFWFAVSILLCRFKLRDIKIPEAPLFPAENPHHVRLFDDASLAFDPSFFDPAQNPGGPNPNLAGRFFPSGRRELVKLWWEGSGDLFVRVDRYQLVFNFTETSAGAQIVPAPIGPMTLTEFGQFLTDTIQDAANQTGKLKVALLHPRDTDYELPPGATFADHGDAEATLAKHALEAAKFKKLGTSQDNTDYILYHAPKAAQSVRFGTTGPVANPFDTTEPALRTEEDRTGYPYVYDELSPNHHDSLMGFAADFGALLCLGAVPHLDAAPEADRIHQVFRNWSLDRRRVNEWRMLVAGGAVSEKGADPATFDPAMLRPANPAAWRSKLSGASLEAGEQAARDMGWVPLFREWFDVARRPTLDSLAAERFKAANPPNKALTQAMAFLLDLAEPAGAP